MKGKKLVIFSILFLILLQITVFADFKKRESITLTDADGVSVELFITGDEYVSVLHDDEDYVMVRTEQGYFDYAVLENNELVPSGGKKMLKYADIPTEYFVGKREEVFAAMEQEGVIVPGAQPELFSGGNARKEFKGKGTVIVVPIAFSGGSTDFNGFTQTVENACKYYEEVSHGELMLDYLDVSEDGGIFVSDRDELYYHPYSSTNTIGYISENNRLVRENNLVKAALDFYGLENKTIDKPIDVDSDGNNDFLVFVYNTRYEAVWSSLLWPHQLRYDYAKYNVFGKNVTGWIFVSRSGGDETLCHEMYHAIGAPDLYDYSGANDYVGMWDIMDSGNGTMLAYMKYKYGGWIDEIPEITEAGTYTLNPASADTNNCLKIPINENEYYVLEYRNRFTGRINYLDRWRQWHQEGLLITRVNSLCNNGNMDASKGIEVDVMKHPALSINSILGAVLPEFSPESGFDRTLQSGEVDDKTVIRNIRENSDGTLSFDLSFDGSSQVKYQSLDDVEIVPQFLRDRNDNIYCELTPCSVTYSSDGTKQYTKVDGVYNIEYIYLTGRETSANSYDYLEYNGPFVLNRSGILWAYLTDSEGVRLGKPHSVYIHYNVPGINTTRGIRSNDYTVAEFYEDLNYRLINMSFEDSDDYVSKLNMDKIISFTVGGIVYEFTSEDIKGKTLNFAAENVEVNAGDGSEVYMNGLWFENYATTKTILLNSEQGRSSLFESAETISQEDEISLDVLGSFSGEIRYTTDGTAPDMESLLYVQPLKFDEDTVLTCGAFENGDLIKQSAFNIYVQDDYREYSCDELIRIFKNSGSSFSGGDGKYLKVTYNAGEGSLVLRNGDWVELVKIINPTESGVIYLDAGEEIFVQEASGENITVTIVDSTNQVDLTILQKNGNEAVVVMHNFGDDVDFQLVSAGLSGDRLERALTYPVSLEANETDFIRIDAYGETVKVFCVNSLSEIKPIGRAVSK